MKKSDFRNLLVEGSHKIYFGHAGPIYNTKYEK